MQTASQLAEWFSEFLESNLCNNNTELWVDADELRKLHAVRDRLTDCDRLRERVKELEGAAKDFVRNCPACHGAGELPDAMTSDGLSPAGLCVWCAKFRAALPPAAPQ